MTTVAMLIMFPETKYIKMNIIFSKKWKSIIENNSNGNGKFRREHSSRTLTDRHEYWHRRCVINNLKLKRKN